MSTTLDWIAELARAGSGCWDLAQHLNARIRAQQPDEADAQLILLADIAGLVFEPTARAPFRPRIPSVQIGIDGLNDAALHWLDTVAPELPVDLRARVRDILWIRRRGGEERGHAVVRDYCEAAVALRDLGALRPDRPASRMARARGVALRMKWDEGLDLTLQTFVDLLRSDATLDPHRLGLAEIAREFGDDAAREAAELMERLAEQELSTIALGTAANWDWPRRALEVAADDFDAAQLRDRAKSVRLRRAETFIEHAEWLTNVPGASTLLRAGLLEDAVLALRRAGADRDAIDRVHRELRDLQQRALDEFADGEPIAYDVTETALNAIGAVRDKSFRDALVALARLGRPTSLAHLRDYASQAAETFIAQRILPTRKIADDGRTVVTYIPQQDHLSDEALLPTMLEYLRIDRLNAARGVVMPACHRIALEHPATLDDWTELLGRCPLVQPGHLRSLAKGLHAGFQFDLLVAVPVLLPQLEHLLRLIVQSRGGLTTTIREDRTQQQHLLKALLDKKELTEAIGDDEVFGLKGLLIDQGTGNLRNDVLHGLVDDGRIASTDGICLWHAVLRLVLLTGIAELEPRPADANG